MEPSDDWLAATNERYREVNIPPVQRPFRAIAEFSNELSRSIEISSAIAKRIFAWFKANTKPGSHAIGAMFTSAFFYDACFWPVSIPIGYGRLRVDAFDALDTMQPTVKATLLADRQQIWIYTTFWADCADYAYGLSDTIAEKNMRSRAISFLRNADHELAGAVSQLLGHRPNPKAILSARMAVEIFLKTFLIQEMNLDEGALKKLGHKIDKLAEECSALLPSKDFAFIRKNAGLFPDVSSRYDGPEHSLPKVWEAFFLAQFTGATVVRRYSGRDTRPQIAEER